MKLVCCLLVFAALSATAQVTPRAAVEATGTATISVTPDQAQINISAITQAPSAQDAVSQNATIAANIIGQVTQAVGSSGAVKTVAYAVSPNYTYPQNAPAVLSGFTVTNTIQVTLTDLTITGKIIDTATQAGASRIDSLQFTLKDDTDARSQALRAATVKAKAKADAMAASVGLKTGNFFAIQEAGAVVQPMRLGATAGTAATPVQAGTLDVTGNVTISVELSQ